MVFYFPADGADFFRRWAQMFFIYGTCSDSGYVDCKYYTPFLCAALLRFICAGLLRAPLCYGKSLAAIVIIAHQIYSARSGLNFICENPRCIHLRYLREIISCYVLILELDISDIVFVLIFCMVCIVILSRGNK